MSGCYVVRMSFCHFVILSFCHFVMLSCCHVVKLSCCHVVMLSCCHVVMLSCFHVFMLSWCHEDWGLKTEYVMMLLQFYSAHHCTVAKVQRLLPSAAPSYAKSSQNSVLVTNSLKQRTRSRIWHNLQRWPIGSCVQCALILPISSLYCKVSEAVGSSPAGKYQELVTS